jgi:hypothetical protein
MTLNTPLLVNGATEFTKAVVAMAVELSLNVTDGAVGEPDKAGDAKGAAPVT